MKFKEWLINEINQEIATRIKSVSHRTLNNVFGKKDRIAVPFGIDPSAKYLVKKLDDEEYDYETGLLTRTAKNGSPEKVKLMKLIDSLELPEPVINWAKKQPDIYKSLKTTKEIVTKSKDSNENYSIIITRNPIDVVRMGDFDCLPNQAGGRSCHAPSGDFFHHALEEAEKEGGAVAYVVKNEDLKNVDLDQDEIFADPERNKDGIYPVSRIRIRRFESKSDKSEVAVPEMKMYGKSMPGFFFTLKNFLRNKQEIDELDPEDHVLTGGTYFDTGKEKLFKNFFDDEADYVEDEGGYEEVMDDDEDDYETVMENERTEALQLIRRERDNLPNNVEIVFEQEGPGMGLYFRAKYEKTLEVSIKDIPENSEVMKSKENEWNKFSDEFINESIKELSEIHALSTYFSVRKDQMLNNCFYKINDTKFTSSDDKKVWFKFLIYWIPSDHRRYHRDVTGLENFIDDIVGKFTGDYNYIEKILRQNLEEYNYISHHPISNMLKQKSEEFQDKYENISTSHVDVDKNDTSEKPHYAEFTISVRVLSEIKDDQDKFIYEKLAKSWYRSDQGTKLQFVGFSSSQESAYLERYVRAIKEFKEKFLQKLYSFSQDVFPRFQTNVTINSDHLASPYNIPIELKIHAPYSSNKDPIDRNSPIEFSEHSWNKRLAINFDIHINQTSDRNVTIFLLELFDFYNKNKQKLDQFIAKDFNTKILVPLVASMKTIRP